MDFQKLNEIASNTFPPCKKWKDLEKRSFIIIEIKKVKTDYGKRMVFVIDDDGEKFQIFVPTRVSNPLYENEEMYYNLCAKANKYELSIMHKGYGKFEFV